MEPIEEVLSFDENNENYISKKNNTRQPITAMSLGIDDTSTPQIIEIDRQKIFQEELAKIQKMTLFAGINLKDEGYFSFDKS